MKQPNKKKQRGFVVSLEMVLISTIVVIGLIVGLVAIREAMVAEMYDVARAINSIDNSYSFAGIAYTTAGGATYASIAGSSFNDNFDTASGQVLDAADPGAIHYSLIATAE